MSERDYEHGKRAVWRDLFCQASRALGYDGAAGAARAIAELEETRAVLMSALLEAGEVPDEKTHTADLARSAAKWMGDS